MNYEKLMLGIKNKYFPELKNVTVRVKPLWILNIRLLDLISFRPLMWVCIFDKNIYYNKTFIKRKEYDKNVLTAVFAHELAHILQYNRSRLNWFQKIIILLKEWGSTIFDKKYISKIEKEADRIVIKKGLGKFLIKHRKFGEDKTSERIYKIKSERIRKIIKKIHDSRINKTYYSSEELKKIIRKRK